MWSRIIGVVTNKIGEFQNNVKMSILRFCYDFLLIKMKRKYSFEIDFFIYFCFLNLKQRDGLF